MPRHKREDYQCIRCGYTTSRKSSMHDHLFKVQKPCPGSLNKIELTSELKKEILENRVAKLPEDKTARIINNINMINNFLGNIDPIDKLGQMLDYQATNLIGFGEVIEDKHKVKIRRLEYDDYKYLFKMEHEDMENMIDQSTRTKDGIREMNIIYNDKCNKIWMYHDDEWNEYRIERGIQQIIRVYQTYFFDYYERFMIKRIFQDPKCNAFMRNNCLFQLKEYCRYLAIFGLKPYANDRENSELVTSGPYLNHSNPNYIEEQIMRGYREAESQLKKSDIKEYRKTILDIIKRNSQSNIRGLNDAITSLFNIDDNFKKIFIEKNGLKIQ